jgi:hypothetical protein
MLRCFAVERPVVWYVQTVMLWITKMLLLSSPGKVTIAPRAVFCEEEARGLS